MAVRKRFWTLLVRREGRFLPEFGSFVRGEAIVKMSELRLKGVRRIDLKIITSDPDLSAIAKDVEALIDAPDDLSPIDNRRPLAGRIVASLNSRSASPSQHG